MNRLKVVTKDDKKNAQVEALEESLKLTRVELAKRVHELRIELEAAKARYDGALFDNYVDGIPPSLDIVDVNREPYGAVYYLAPLVKTAIEQPAAGKVKGGFSDDVFGLYFSATQTAFELGMLAGAIYADSPPATIDRFERGLITALASCSWIVKKAERL